MYMWYLLFFKIYYQTFFALTPFLDQLRFTPSRGLPTLCTYGRDYHTLSSFDQQDKNEDPTYCLQQVPDDLIDLWRKVAAVDNTDGEATLTFDLNLLHSYNK